MNTEVISAKTDKEMKEALRVVSFEEKTNPSDLVRKGLLRLPKVMKEYKKQKSLTDNKALN